MFKIGILGFSSRGHGFHYAKLFNAASSSGTGPLRSRVTAVWDPEPGVAQAFLDRFPGVQVFQKPHEVVESTDAGMIMTLDPYDYLSLASLWLAQGKPVFVNRPFAATPEDTRAMINLAESRGTRVWSASSLALSPHIPISTEKIKELCGPLVYFAAISSGTPLFYLPHILAVAVGVVGTGAESVVASGVINPMASGQLHLVPAMAEIPRFTGITALINYNRESAWGAFQGIATFQAGDRAGYEFGAICRKGRLPPQDYADGYDVFESTVQAIDRFFVDGVMPTDIRLSLEICELYHAIRISLQTGRPVTLAEFRS